MQIALVLAEFLPVMGLSSLSFKFFRIVALARRKRLAHKKSIGISPFTVRGKLDGCYSATPHAAPGNGIISVR
jgi:hypothetical protein